MLTVRTPLPVRCLNCGNDHVLAVIGLIIAAAAFVVALVALYIAIREHGLFIDRLNAQARFQLTVRVMHGVANNGLEIQPGVSSVMARLEIGWENKGEKAAGATTMEVIVPGSIPEFQWTDKWRGAIRFWTGSDFAAPPATRRGRDAGSVGERRDTAREARSRRPSAVFRSGLNPA